jgi:hypothetical protein
VKLCKSVFDLFNTDLIYFPYFRYQDDLDKEQLASKLNHSYNINIIVNYYSFICLFLFCLYSVAEGVRQLRSQQEG